MKKTPNTTTAPTGNIAPFGLRMLPELRDKVEEAAKSNGRSMNAEIVARLQQSFAETTQPLQDLKTGELIDELMRRFPPGMVEVRVGKVDDDTP